jgi:hypothetical protein
MNNGLSSESVTDLLVTPSQDILACTSGSGLYRSTNNGTTFAQVAGVPSFPTRLAQAGNGDLFVGIQFNTVNAMISTNGGANWAARDLGLDADLIDVTSAPGSQFGMYGAGGNKIYKTTNSGMNWTSMNAPVFSSYTGVAAMTNGNVYAANYGGILQGGRVFHTTNQGTTWTEDSGLPGHAVSQFLATPDQLFLEVYGPGIHRLASNGITWEQKAEGMHNVLITEVETDEDDDRIYTIAEALGIYTSTDDGLHWTPSGNGIPIYEFFYDLEVSPTALYASGAYNGIYKSTNGLDWTPSFSVAANALGSNDLGHVFAGFGNRVYRTTNQGVSWPFFATLAGVQQIVGIVCEGTQVNVATSNAGVWRSTNNGDSFWAMNAGLTNLFTTSIDLDPDPGSDCRLSVGTTNGIFDYDEQSQSWDLNASYSFGQISRLRKTPDQIAVLEEDRLEKMDQAAMCIYSETMTGLTSLTDYATERVGTRRGGDPEFVQVLGTYGYGLWRASAADPTGVDAIRPPANEGLRVGHNPFEGATTLEFELTRPSDVRLEVFDAAGRLVTNLMQGRLEAGRHTATWNAAGRASGMYFSRLSTGDEVSMQKLILLR